MTPADLRHLYAYTEWANDRVLTAAEGLTEEQYLRAVGGSFASIRATLAHMVAVEWLWLRRWLGENPTTMPGWAIEPSVATLRSRLREVEKERAASLGALTPADLTRVIAYTNFRGEAVSFPLGHILPHVVNHATYHRGQVVSMLRIVGASVLPTDFLYFPPAGA